MHEFQVMASNDLRSGRVIYLTANGWSDDLHTASRLDSETALEAARQRAELALQDNQVIDPYLVQVTEDDYQPTHIREQIRYSGPTCLPLSGGTQTNRIAG